MKKTLFSSILIVMLTFFNIVQATDISFKINDENIVINGETKKVAKSFVSNGVTFVPLRVISEAFGAAVEWNDLEQSITLTKSNIIIILRIGDVMALINGNSQELLAAPKKVDGVTFVPIRFISEAFGATVGYDEATKSVAVSEKQKIEVGIKKTESEDGYIKYTNNDLDWSIKILSDWNIDDRIINEIKFYPSNLKDYITISVYNSDEQTFDTAVQNEIDREKSKYPGGLLKYSSGDVLFNSKYMTKTINFTYDDEKELAFNGKVMLFHIGSYKYVVRTHNETGTDFDKMLNSFDAKLITKKLSDEFNEGYKKRYTDSENNHSFLLPPAWTVDKTDGNHYTFSDTVNRYKIEMECVEYQNGLPVQKDRGMPRIQGDVSTALSYVTNTIFNEKFGMLVLKTGYDCSYWGLPDIDKNFAKNRDVFIFDAVETPSAENQEKIKELIKKNIKFNYVDANKVSIYYVYGDKTTLYISNCILNENFSYDINKTIYDEIMKAMIEGAK